MQIEIKIDLEDQQDFDNYYPCDYTCRLINHALIKVTK